MSGDDYLWDRGGAVDPEVARLERLLGRFGMQLPVATPVRPSRPRWPILLAAAAVLLALLWGGRWLLGGGKGSAAPAERIAEAGMVVETQVGAAAQVVRIPDVARLTLRPGSRLRVERVRPEAVFFLERGVLDALVYPEVKPRLVRVDTPAVSCIDLGCEYRLTMEGDSAHVAVTAGVVAFADGQREVRIIQGAECSARVGRGAGTPRFATGDADFRRLLDVLDDTRGPDVKGPPAREEVIAKLAYLAKEPVDALPLWHLLAEVDGAAGKAAELRDDIERKLAQLVDWPPEATQRKAPGGLPVETWWQQVRLRLW